MSLQRRYNSELGDDWARTQSKLLAELGALPAPRTRYKESSTSQDRRAVEQVPNNIALRTRRASSKESIVQKLQSVGGKHEKSTKSKPRQTVSRSISEDNNNKKCDKDKTIKAIESPATKELKKRRETQKRHVTKVKEPKSKDISKSKEIAKGKSVVNGKERTKRKAIDEDKEISNSKNCLPFRESLSVSGDFNGSVIAKRRKSNRLDSIKEKYQILSKELALQSNTSSLTTTNCEKQQVTPVKLSMSASEDTKMSPPKIVKKRKNSNVISPVQLNHTTKIGKKTNEDHHDKTTKEPATQQLPNGLQSAPPKRNKRKSLYYSPQPSYPTVPPRDYTTVEEDGKTWTVPRTITPPPQTFPLTVEKREDKAKDVDMLKETLMRKIHLSNGIEISVPLVPNQPYECNECGRAFRTKQDLLKHMYIHLDVRPHPCPMCDSKFRQRGNLKTHMGRMHAQSLPSVQTYICHHCGARFFVKERIRAHVLKHEEKTYSCQFCKKCFHRQVLLRRHMRDSHRTNRFACFICNNLCPDRQKLAAHIKKHLGVRDLICHVCGKTFGRHDCYNHHVKSIHQDLKRFQCPICNKWLKGHLREHMRTHVHSKPYGCLECGKRFTQSSQLAVHKRSHSGVKPYVCRVCNRPFSYSNALLLHTRVHTGEKPFACAMCPQLFSQLPHMKAHMLSIHNKKEAYKCIDCGQFFKLRATLEGHRVECGGGAGAGKPWLQVEEDAEQNATMMSISKMRFLLAILLRTIADEGRLKILGFNKRLIDDLLVDSLEATGHTPCKDPSVPPIDRLRDNIQLLLNWTVPNDIMQRFRELNKSTEQLLEELTS